MTEKDKRVLSIQSTVVHGYAGGRSAVFPLQLHGFDVDAIHTVQFSNHTGYLQWKGMKTTAPQVLELFEGLQQSGIDNFQYLLTGYLPDAETVAAIGTIAKKLKAKDPETIWILDPVMGDDGALYVAEEVVPMYKSIIPFADIILPNQFEAELLSDCKIDSLHSVETCLQRLHQRYRVAHIVISSIRLESFANTILCCGSTATSTLEARAFVLMVPIIDGPFVGTGDLFAALLLVRLHPYRDMLVPHDEVTARDLPLAKALELVIASMQSVLKETKVYMDLEEAKYGDMHGHGERERHVQKTRAAELRLIGSQQALLRPEVTVRAMLL